MIKFENVSVRFGSGITALNTVSFEIDTNDFVFLVGPSGAGKTTILKLILKQLEAAQGTILVDDLNITSNRFHDIETLRRRIGVIFQDFKILPDKNIFENIALSLKIQHISNAEIRNNVEEVLHLVGLPNKTLLFPSQLSAGELQRIAIARAIIGNRDIILADEPTGNLDPKTSWEIMKIFKKLEKKKTIVFATHNTDIVNSMRRRVFVMKDGHLVKDSKKGGYDI
ncbi:ATP-binding cassette domain-containing protein [Candidatus Microgenomates bacterium]|nr:ATP-binding cassette domain-containing protein [Candidatus Microgenomates bacterium]